jgi:hypothetical protein
VLDIVVFGDHEVGRKDAAALSLAMGAVADGCHRRFAFQLIADVSAQASAFSISHSFFSGAILS